MGQASPELETSERVSEVRLKISDADQFLASVRGCNSLMDDGEFHELLYIYYTGNKRQRQAVKDRVARANVGLVTKIARSYCRRNLTLKDLCQEALIGLLHAIDLFDPSWGIRFSTYAAHWIRRACRCACTETRVDARASYYVPHHWHQAAWIVMRTMNAQGVDVRTQDVTPEAVFEEVTRSASVPDWMSLGIIRRVLSFIRTDPKELPLHGTVDRAIPREVLADVQKILHEGHPTLRRLHGALAAVCERDRQILYWRLGLKPVDNPHALEDISEIFGVTREGIRQIVIRAFHVIEKRTRLRPEQVTEILHALDDLC